MLNLSLSIVRRQQELLDSASVDYGAFQDDLDSLTHRADGDKGVAWADQTRISTNDLQDVNVSNFSLTQQQLFDCFLEHSSPRVRGGLRRDSPQLFPSSLSILTSTTSSILKEEPDGKVTPTQVSSAHTTPTPPPTPRIGAAGTGTVTVRASHTISSRASPHGGADSAAPGGGGGSVTVTTDVRISSDMTGSDPDDLSDVSASSGVTGSYSVTSEPTRSDALDYDLLEKKTTPTNLHPSSKKLTVAERTRTTAFDLTKVHPATPPTRASLYGPRSLTTPYLASRTSQDRTPLGVATAPQPYSMFQPFQQRPPIRSLSSTQVATPPYSSATPLSTSQHSASTESGLGRATSLPGHMTPQPGHPNRNRGQLLIPNRPLANGFMVRSSPSSSYYGNGGQFYGMNRMSGFEDSFVSPPLQQQRAYSDTRGSGHVIKSPPGTGPMKIPIGARLKSPFSSLSTPFMPRQQTATPNPYVKAPAHLPRPPHVYQSITIPGPTHLPQPPAISSNRPDKSSRKAPAASADQRSNLSKSTALSGSKCSLNEDCADSTALNSTFTVEVGVAKTSGPAHKPAECSNGKKDKVGGEGGKKGAGSQQGGGRGLFSRSRSPGKLPSYLKMTKSTESKKVSRYVCK